MRGTDWDAVFVAQCGAALGFALWTIRVYYLDVM